MGFFDKEYRQQLRQQRLMEKELRLKNDPGAIFMRSLAAEAPGALYSLAGNLAIDAAKYNLFGGKEAEDIARKKQYAEERHYSALEGAEDPLALERHRKKYNLFPDSLKPGTQPSKPGELDEILGTGPKKPQKRSELDKILAPKQPVKPEQTELDNILDPPPAPEPEPVLTYKQEAIKQQQEFWKTDVLPATALEAAAKSAEAAAEAGKKAQDQAVDEFKDIMKKFGDDRPAIGDQEAKARLNEIYATTEPILMN